MHDLGQPDLSPERMHELLGVLCTRLGFCLPPDDWNRLAEAPPPDVDDFTDAVFVAEGLAPDWDGEGLRTHVRAVVARYLAPRHPAP